ncbi:MAG: porin [Nitrospirales bacterium]
MFVNGRTVLTPILLLIVWGLSPLSAHAGDTLADVLREKGAISKEDYIRIQANEEKKAAEGETEQTSQDIVKIGWGKKGFTLSTADGLFKTAIQWRFQGRFTYPDRGDEDSVGDFSDNDESTFELRRVRMKVGGHGYKPWIKYYFEVDWQPTRSSGTSGSHTRLLDWRIMIEKYQWFQIRLGQWKINYNRERVDSSGKQQFVERSIVNSVFTIDRQVGIMAYGHLAPGTLFDSWYYAGVFTGSGRGEANDDDQMMYMARFQWNFLGRDLKWSQSDIKYHEKPAGSLAIGGYTTIGKCTRWSSTGCGSLAGFTSDSSAVDGQFRVEGIVEEFALKWRGLSIQHEYHWKQIKDAGKAAVVGTTVLPATSFIAMSAAVPSSRTNLMGSYAQIGYFPHYLIPIVPKPLELAFRYAFVDPNISVKNDKRQEFTFATNWFFAGHRNKVTMDVSHLTLAVPTGKDLTEQRFRLQWDVSF